MQSVPRTACSRIWASPQMRVPSPSDADDATLALWSIIRHLLWLMLPRRGGRPDRRRADEGEDAQDDGRHQDPRTVHDSGAVVPLVHRHQERPGGLADGIERAETDPDLLPDPPTGSVESQAGEHHHAQ